MVDSTAWDRSLCASPRLSQVSNNAFEISLSSLQISPDSSGILVEVAQALLQDGIKNWPCPAISATALWKPLPPPPALGTHPCCPQGSGTLPERSAGDRCPDRLRQRPAMHVQQPDGAFCRPDRPEKWLLAPDSFEARPRIQRGVSADRL